MSKAAELAALIGGQKALGDKNIIINGAMTVNQRGNQTNTSGSAVYFVDRWNFIETTGALAANLQQSTVVPSGQGFGNSLLIDCTTVDSSVAASHVSVVRQVIEGQNLQRLAYGTSSAKSLTISFWVRSTKTGVYNLEIYHYNSSGGNSRTQNHSYTISQADTWEYKTIIFSGDTSLAADNDNRDTFYVQWALSAGSDLTSGTQQTTWGDYDATKRFAGQVNFFDSTDNNFYLTGVQMEVGDVATPFEHEDYGTTLAKCQRYFQKISGGSDRFVYAGKGQGTTTVDATIPLTVSLRASPTMNAVDSRAFNDAGLTTSSSTTPTVNNYSDNDTHLAINIAGFSGLTNNEVNTWGLSSNQLNISAEL